MNTPNAYNVLKDSEAVALAVLIALSEYWETDKRRTVMYYAFFDAVGPWIPVFKGDA